MDTDPVYHRPELAERTRDALLGSDPLLQVGKSGLFLAGPRRTGKSTFLKADLIPALEAAGAITIYVDLWADKARDPADLIAEAIRAKLADTAGLLKKSSSAISKVKKLAVKAAVGGVEGEFGFEIESVGAPGGTTLARAFEGLHTVTKKQIVFILDEAQHAPSSKQGSDALFALKAARDALNLTAARPNLAILATGSVRGKLSDMVSRKSQAFYGAAISDLPSLGEDFVQHLLLTMLGHRIPVDQLPPAAAVMPAFVRLGRRPEELAEAIRLGFTHHEHDLAAAIMSAANQRHELLVAELRHQFERLQGLQQSILRLMAEKDDAFAPFSKESVKRYQDDTRDKSVTWARAQKALEGLIRLGLVWRSATGAYALDDELLADLLYAPEAVEALPRAPSS